MAGARRMAIIAGERVALYKSRRAAVAAARQACRKALASSIYQAYEGPDYEIHPKAREGEFWEDDFYFRLRGPAKEAMDQGG